MCILTYSELYLRLQPHYIMRATHLQAHLTTSVKQPGVFDLTNNLIKKDRVASRKVLMNISENREDVTCGYVRVLRPGLYNRIENVLTNKCVSRVCVCVYVKKSIGQR